MKSTIKLTKLEQPNCLPQRMSNCPVPTDGFKKPKNLKVLTHNFEVGIVLLKVLSVTIRYPKTQKIGPRVPIGLS